MSFIMVELSMKPPNDLMKVWADTESEITQFAATWPLYELKGLHRRNKGDYQAVLKLKQESPPDPIKVAISRDNPELELFT